MLSASRLFAGLLLIHSLFFDSQAQADVADDEIETRLFGLPIGKVRKPKIGQIKWNKCSNEVLPGSMEKLELKLDKDGDIIITIELRTEIDLKPPVKLDMVMHRKLLGMWARVPCLLGAVGSCKVNDLCKFGETVCPFKPLIDNNIPCQCPIKKGVYSMTNANFPMPTTSLAGGLSGSYKTAVKLEANGKPFACYKATFVIS